MPRNSNLPVQCKLQCTSASYNAHTSAAIHETTSITSCREPTTKVTRWKKMQQPNSSSAEEELGIESPTDKISDDIPDVQANTWLLRHYRV